MKKIILFIFIFFLTASISQAQISECTETDGGHELFTKGINTTVESGKKEVHEDRCYDPPKNSIKVDKSDYLAELTCSEGKLYPNYNIKCPNGCEFGACLGGGTCKDTKKKICDKNESEVHDSVDIESFYINNEDNRTILNIDFLYDNMILGTVIDVKFSNVYNLSDEFIVRIKKIIEDDRLKTIFNVLVSEGDEERSIYLGDAVISKDGDLKVILPKYKLIGHQRSSRAGTGVFFERNSIYSTNIEIYVEKYKDRLPDKGSFYVKFDKEVNFVELFKDDNYLNDFISKRKKSDDIYKRLKGKILLKVEDDGKAYYINPSSRLAYYLARPKDAYDIIRTRGRGITNLDLYKIPIGVRSEGKDLDKDGLPDSLEDALGLDPNNIDTDGDGFDDQLELQNQYNPWGKGKQNIDKDFSNKQKGKIFIQTENNGEAWYVNPEDAKRYFLDRPADAFGLMRDFGVGISNSDFDALSLSVEIHSDLYKKLKEIGFEDRFKKFESNDSIKDIPIDNKTLSSSTAISNWKELDRFVYGDFFMQANLYEDKMGNMIIIHSCVEKEGNEECYPLYGKGDIDYEVLEGAMSPANVIDPSQEQYDYISNGFITIKYPVKSSRARIYFKPTKKISRVLVYDKKNEGYKYAPSTFTDEFDIYYASKLPSTGLHTLKTDIYDYEVSLALIEEER